MERRPSLGRRKPSPRSRSRGGSDPGSSDHPGRKNPSARRIRIEQLNELDGRPGPLTTFGTRVDHAPADRQALDGSSVAATDAARVASLSTDSAVPPDRAPPWRDRVHGAAVERRIGRRLHPAHGRRPLRNTGVAGLRGRGGRPRRPGPRRRNHAQRPGARPATPRDPAGIRQHRLRQHDPRHSRAAVPGRRGHRAADPRLRSLERRHDGPPRATTRPRGRRAHLDLRLDRDALRSGVQPLLPRPRRTTVAGTRSTSRATHHPASTPARSSRDAWARASWTASDRRSRTPARAAACRRIRTPV